MRATAIHRVRARDGVRDGGCGSGSPDGRELESFDTIHDSGRPAFCCGNDRGGVLWLVLLRRGMRFGFGLWTCGMADDGGVVMEGSWLLSLVLYGMEYGWYRCTSILCESCRVHEDQRELMKIDEGFNNI